jgi:hypothetical protein
VTKLQLRLLIISAAAIALCACQESAQGRKLDINYATTTGVGSTLGAALSLPHGRYTFFTYADPPNCLQSVALLDHGEKPVADDGSLRIGMVPASLPPGVPTTTANSLTMQMVPTLVQKELQSGSYRIKVTTRSSGCAWEVEQILNYILSSEAPPPAAVPPSAPDVNVSLNNSSTDLHFRIPTAGLYEVRWSVTPCDRYSGEIIRSDGGTDHLGDGTAAAAPPGSLLGPQSSDTPAFLGAGDWTTGMATRCFWQLQVSPVRGSLGGGTQGFGP